MAEAIYIVGRSLLTPATYLGRVNPGAAVDFAYHEEETTLLMSTSAVAVEAFNLCAFGMLRQMEKRPSWP